MELRTKKGTEYIAEQSYAGDENIERLILPDGLRGIGEEAFSGCAMLRELILPQSLETLGAASFCGCEALERVVLPEGLERIGEGAFLGCGALKEIRFPAGLREIGAMAFWNTGLERVDVPVTVERVEDKAFWECEVLQEANILNPNAFVGEDVFGICYELKRGYIAPGYCGRTDAPTVLMYTLLWCSSYERHSEATSERAREYIRENEALIMERIFKYNNAPALTGIVRQGLLKPENVNAYVRTAAEQGLTELTALLLKARGAQRNIETEFEL